MFRIVQIKIPENILRPLIDDDKPSVTRLRATCDLHYDKHTFISEPMPTTSVRFFNAEQCLRSMFGDPPHLIEDITAEYRLLRTRAPKSYDYSYVVEVGTMEGEFGTERLVAIPRTSVDYQSGRYASGMYTPITCD